MEHVSMEQLISLCKRRGFIFQGSEIYGGLAGTYDYGPLGSLLKNNIKTAWIKKFVADRDDTFLLDAAILMNAKVWEATGHVAEFIDPLVDDVVTHKRYRADHLLEENGIEAEKLTLQQMNDAVKNNNLKSPDGNALGEVRAFNMMLQTRVGAAEDSSAISYLRPETAQGIFVNYKNVMDSMSPKIPFGIAQVGKAFRNEITPRDFIFRLRELEQMEIEYFIHPSMWQEKFEYWLTQQQEFFAALGIGGGIHQYEHPDEARSHYSKRTVDWNFDFAFGTKELSGLAYRTDFDLTRHGEYSGTRLEYTDPFTNEKYVPHVIEPSFGLDRAVLAVLTAAYAEDMSGEEARVFLKLPVTIAPYKACVSPLLKNKPELVEKARTVFTALKESFGMIAWDDNGNIGKRYRRQDEIGTPYCITVDFDTLENDTITVRDRDTATQDRVAIADLEQFLKGKLQ